MAQPRQPGSSARAASQSTHPVLRKCIHQPVVLASVDDDDLRGPAAKAGVGASHENDRELVASAFSLSLRNFKCAHGNSCEELLKFFGILPPANAIAKQNRGAFDIVRFPRLKKLICCGQGRHIIAIDNCSGGPVVAFRGANDSKRKDRTNQYQRGRGDQRASFLTY
jgi:hypothetical protein